MRKGFGFTEGPKARVALTASMILVAASFLVTQVLPRLERFLVLQEATSPIDALVVLAGSPAERIPAAAELYKEGMAPRILLANDGILGAWSMEHQRNLWQVEWAELKLVRQGIPKEAIVKLSYSESGTLYDALNTVSFVTDSEIRSLLIVTSDYHTRRTLWTFRQAFKNQSVRLWVYPAKSSCLDGEKSQLNPSRLRCLMLEGGKYIYYRLRYGLSDVFSEND